MENESFDDFNSNLKLPTASSLYWIHCNRCFEIYMNKRRRLFMLSCFHVICEICVTAPASNSMNAMNAMNAVNEVNCPFCNKLSGYRVICNVMPAHVKELLNPEPWIYPNERILQFQAWQKENFKRGMLRKRYELEKMKRKCKALEIIAKQKYDKYEQLRHERKGLEREVLKLKKRESKPKSAHLQTSSANVYNNRPFTFHSFPGYRRESADRRAHSVGHSLSHTTLYNSFSLNI